MIEVIRETPDVDVQPDEYRRLLGYPRDWVIRGRARELADWARAWYAEHGRPWVYARHADALDVQEDSFLVDGVRLSSSRLEHTLRQAAAHRVVLVAVTAGPELESHAQQLWNEGKPDEYYFLEVYGSAVVEHLTTMTGAELCAWADGEGMAVLPHYSPGYPEWDVSEQPRLLELIRRDGDCDLLGGLDVLDSGMLRPKKSLLAVFGVTRHVDRVKKLSELMPCENCSFLPCQYRRAPYRQLPESFDPGAIAILSGIPRTTDAKIAPESGQAKYTVHLKALKKWADSRLTLQSRDDGTTDALFRYEGTTCSNMGRPLAFDYRVKLGPRHEGYPIREQRCAPAPDDVGHTCMCEFLICPDELMESIRSEKPLLGQPLEDALIWNRPSTAPGCHCVRESRDHKWGLVLETIHYALSQRENNGW